MKVVIFLTLSVLAVHSFVLDSQNSSSLTPHDFRQLVDLLVEEKHLRGQLEGHVNQLEQEMHNNEGRLDAFNLAFNKEKSNRHQLEQSYTQLSIAFHNLSMDHNTLIARNKELEAKFLNLTRISQDKLSSMDTSISQMNRTIDYLTNETVKIQALNQSVSSYFVEVDKNISSLTHDVYRQQQQLASIDSDNKAISLSVATNQAEVSANRAEITKNRANITSARAGVATNLAKISTNQANIATNTAGVSQIRADLLAKGRTISTNHADIASLKTKAGYQIGFSASGHTVVSGILKFDSVKTNYGNRYSTSTGKFTCNHAGLYFFALSLIKERAAHTTADMAYCYIKKNTSNLIYTQTDPRDDDTDNGSYETSAFIVVHLSSGDTVYAGGCTATDHLNGYSSFSGVLIRAD